jgi:phosphatidate cytidylyltransferase
MFCGYGFMLWNVHEKMQLFGIPVSEIGKWIVIIIAVVLPIKEIVLSKKDNVKVMGFSVIGLAYISLSWGLMISLRKHGMNFKGNVLSFNFDFVTPIILIASIWINDTMAYIVGSLIGKTPLSSVSPKKTWEGTIGGVLLSIITIGIAGRYLPITQVLGWQHWVSIAAIAAVFGTLGDLFESKLKRLADVKDSGSFMPGHGGFLDRFDSLLIAIPFVWIYIQLIF